MSSKKPPFIPTPGAPRGTPSHTPGRLEVQRSSKSDAYEPGRLTMLRAVDPGKSGGLRRVGSTGLLGCVVGTSVQLKHSSGDPEFAAAVNELNARRLAACWNHFVGVSTEDIETANAAIENLLT